MSVKKLTNISKKQIEDNGVQALATHPNRVSQYGTSGLSAVQLKLWFDKLATLIVEKVNELQNVISSDQAGEYINIPLGEYRVYTLGELITSFKTGLFARIMKILPTYASTGDDLVSAEMAVKELNRTLADLDTTARTQLIHDIQYGLDEYEISYNIDFLDINGTRFGGTTFPYKIDPGRIRAGSIDNEKIGYESISTEKIQDNAVIEGKLATMSVSTRNLRNNSVTAEKLDSHVRGQIVDLVNGAFQKVSYNAANGVLTFLSQGNNPVGSVDLPLELIVSGGRYDGTEGSEAIILVLANGDEIRIPVGDLINSLLDDINDLIGKIRIETICETAADDALKEIAWTGNPLVKGDIILVKFSKGNNSTTPSLKITTGADTITYTIYRNGGTEVSDAALKMPADYIAYLRVEQDRLMMLNPITGGSNIDDGAVGLGTTWSSQKTADELARPEHKTMIVTIAKEGNAYKADYTSAQIINHAQTGVVIAKYDDDVSGETRTYQYTKQTSDRRAVFSKDGYIENSVSKQTLIYVDYAGNITVENRETEKVVISQTTGQSETEVMSQKAVTDIILPIKAGQESNTKRIENLEAGIPPSDFIIDDSVAYTKDVPANVAPYASIPYYGGMTHKTKNLIPFPYTELPNGEGSVEKMGITFTVKNDGSITVNGTAADSVSFYLYEGTLSLEKNSFLSGCLAGGSLDNYLLIADTYSDSGEGILVNSGNVSLVRIRIGEGYTANNLVFYPILNEGLSALPYEPYFEGLRDSKTTAVESVGANLIPQLELEYGSGVTVAYKDGEYKFSGTATAFTVFSADVTGKGFNAGNIYSMAMNANKTIGSTYNDSAYIILDPLDGLPWQMLVSCVPNESVQENKTLAYDVKKIVLSIPTGVSVDGLVIKPMLNKGSSALPYTPYKKFTLPIPAAVQDLPDYGVGINEKYYNYVEWDKKEYHHIVKRLSLRSVQDTFFDSSEGFIKITLGAENHAKTNEIYMMSEIGVDKEVKYGYFSNNAHGDFSDFYLKTAGMKKLGVANSAELKEKLKTEDLFLVYVVTKQTVTDISNLLPDNVVKVEGGGTVTPVNEFEQPTPWTVIYQKKGGTSNG